MSGTKERIDIFHQTMEMCSSNAVLKEAVSHSIQNQCVYWEGETLEPCAANNAKPARVILSRKRTVEAALAPEYRGYRIGILNFASCINPGGGVLRGTTTQEEAICRISTLYPALYTQVNEGGFYQRHREWIKAGLMGRENRDDCIYTPDVMVFRNDTFACEMLAENQWIKIDVLTCAAPDQRWNGDGTKFSPSSEELENLFIQRIEMIFKVAAKHGIEVLILGAFGCGAFGNSPDVVAKAFEKGMLKYISSFQVIEFAVYAGSTLDRNYQAFTAIKGIEIKEDSAGKVEFVVPEECKTIDGMAVERTLMEIASHTCICAEDCTDHQMCDEALKRSLIEKAQKFGGGVRGLVSYKRFQYALQYVRPMTENMRYRYVAAAILMIGNPYLLNERADAAETFRKVLSVFLTNHGPLGNDYLMDHGLNWQNIITQIQNLYQKSGAIELLTILKVLKALEWDENRISALTERMASNRFWA